MTDYNDCLPKNNSALGSPEDMAVPSDPSSEIYAFGYILSFAALTFAIIFYFMSR